MCIKLKKAFYGLKQSAGEWYDNIDSFLQSLSFKMLQSEHCLYIYSKNNIISLYVADLIIAGTGVWVTNRIKESKSLFHERFRKFSKEFWGVVFGRNPE